jgi:NDP-sugar pyrophosphorylase family protein
VTVSTAYVLAAGLGTRLRPLTNERAKPLVEVCGTPLICFALKLLEDAGVRRVGINSHWLDPQIPNTLGRSFGRLELSYTHEPGVLGTGGGLRGLSKLLPAPAGERVLVMNADALIDLDLRALVATPDDALATLVLKSTPDAKKYGLIGTDDDERVVTFANRIEPRGVPTKERMFCGVHCVHPKAFDVLPPVDVTMTSDGHATASGPESGINDEGYPVWLKQGALLRGFDMTGTFCDVGTPERLLEANLAILTGAWSSRSLAPFERFVEERPGVYVHPRARVHPAAQLHAPVLVDDGAVIAAGANVGFSVVGARCEVKSAARVAGSVLQSGAVVDELVIDTIVSPASRMKVDASVADPIRAEWQARAAR